MRARERHLKQLVAEKKPGSHLFDRGKICLQRYPATFYSTSIQIQLCCLYLNVNIQNINLKQSFAFFREEEQLSGELGVERFKLLAFLK